jgi:hypothetical protein
MTTNHTTEDRLATLGLHLPEAPTPLGRTYPPCRRETSLS